MLVTGIIFSTVAMFLGLITKLPQGGGGLTKNLLALTFFLPAPPLPPTPLQKIKIFNLEAAVTEIQLYHLSNSVMTGNGTNGPMPRLHCSTSSSPSPDNATFTSSTFNSSAFYLPKELTQYWTSIGTAIMMLMALCLPWLVIKKISILGKIDPAPHVAIRPTGIGFGPLVAQIEPLNPLLEDLKIIISERDRAFANLQSTGKQAWEAEMKAKEKDARNNEVIEELCSERRKLVKELNEGKKLQTNMEEERKEEVKAWAEKIAMLEKEKKEAVDELHEKASSQTKIIEELCSERKKLVKELNEGKKSQTNMEEERKEEVKAWAEKIAMLEKEKKEAVDELHEKASSQTKIIEELCSERKKLVKELNEGKKSQTNMEEERKEEVKAWAEKIAMLEKEKKEAVDELHEKASSQTKIWTEKERNWEDERAIEKQRHNEAIDSLKIDQERNTESWRIQIEDLKQVQKGEKQASSAQLKKLVEKIEEEREGWRREREEFEEKRIEAENFWANANDCAQRHIANLEAENKSLKYSEAKRQKQTAEAEAAMKAAEVEKEQGQKRAEAEAKESIATLKKEVLNGQTLIEDLLADKRRDRELLLELRAQLVRPTHFAPPHHMNPARFGGTSFPPFRERPIILGTSAPSPNTGYPALPIGNPPLGFTPHTATSLPFQLTSSRPTVRLPPSSLIQPRPVTGFVLAAAKNAHQESKKDGRSGPSRGAEKGS